MCKIVRLQKAQGALFFDSLVFCLSLLSIFLSAMLLFLRKHVNNTIIVIFSLTFVGENAYIALG